MAEPDHHFNVFVRARDPKGRWWSAPVSELTDESFRRFVCDRLVLFELVTAVREEGPPPPYETKSEKPDDTGH